MKKVILFTTIIFLAFAQIVFPQKYQNKYYYEYNYLGNWDVWGVPDYLEATRDTFSTDFESRVSSILIPRNNLIDRHPELLEESAVNTITLQQDADVYSTFYSETAGYRSAIGFYSYKPEDYPDTNKAIQFNGTDQYGRIPYYDALNTEELTVEFWVKPNDDHYFRILRRDGVFDIYVHYDKIKVDVGGSQVQSTSNVINNAWNHVVVTLQNIWSSTHVEIYINGQMNVSSNMGTSLTSNENDITLGEYNNQSNWFLNGAIDEVVLYNKVLTESQIEERYNQGQGTAVYSSGIDSDNDVIAKFSFEEVSNTTTNDCILGSGHDMQLFNFPAQTQGVLGHPPTSFLDLLNNKITIAFPNFSADRSGGKLIKGDKIKIGHFEAGTIIKFFIYSNGFNNFYIKDCYSQKFNYFADDIYNFEWEPENRRHWIMFRDNPSGKLLVAVEDNVRPWGDKDFDDAVMVVGSDPVDAIDQTNIIGYGEQPADPKVDISLTQSVDNSTPSDGDEITFQITAQNSGPSDATNIQVFDKLPDGLIYLSHSASAGSYDTSSHIWEIPSLANGASAQLSITAQVSLEALSQSAFDIGVAKDYNVFVINNMYQPNADAEGRVAVGNEAVFDNFSVGYELRNEPQTLPALLSGYNLTYISGNVYGGDVVYYHETNLPDSNVGIINGEIRQDTLIDFSDAESYLLSLSNTLKEYQANGTVQMTYTQLSMTGTNPFLNVFDVNGEDLTSATETVISVPNGSVVLVNINGDNIDWGGGLVVSGTDISNVMYNFCDAQNITIQGIDVTGSILAPKASINFVSGVQNGQMIAKNLQGEAQYNNVQFIGLIPSDSVLTNIAEVTAVDQEDVDSTPNNGDTSEDDYASVSINFNSEGVINNTGVEWEAVGNSANGGIVWVLTRDKDGNMLSGNWGGGIYRSPDDGATWTQLNPDMDVNYIWSLAVDGETIFAGTEQGVYVSRDNGATWNVALSVSSEIRDIDIFNGKVYAATWGNGVYVSSDNGINWTSLSDDLLNIPITSIVVISDNVIILSSFDSGIWKTTDGGASWEQKSIDYRFVWSLIRNSQGYLFAGMYGDGVYSSIDEGETWQKDFGVTARYIYNFAIDSDSNLYANSWMSGIFVAANAGKKDAAWVNIGLQNESVTTIATGETPEVLYAVTESGTIYKTENALLDVSSENENVMKYSLSQNYPNPFNPETTINFSLKKNGYVTLDVYNSLGQKVAVLARKEFSAGEHSVKFNASNFASGVYFYKLMCNGFVDVKKMILMK